MKKLLGMTAFLLVLYVALLCSHPGARTAYNHFNLAQRIGLYGILGLGAGMLMIAGGIDLSIGSVVALSATLFAMLLTGFTWPYPFAALPSMKLSPALAALVVLAVGAMIGLANGLLVAKLRIQAFVVTLCGLFIYRGLARWISLDEIRGLGGNFPQLRQALASDTNRDAWGLLRPLQRFLAYLTGEGPDTFGVPISFVILLLLGAAATVFLHWSVYGRYLYAIGSNETAARYSGVAVARYRLLAYVLCSVLAAGFGMLFLIDQESVQPSETGSFFELYAITAAVLGGCSLRGGEGTVAGIFIGTAILWLLPNFSLMLGVPTRLEFTVIGVALLLGAALDEFLRFRRRQP